MSVLGYLLPAAFLHGFSHLKLEIVVGYLSFRNFAHIFSHSNAWLRHTRTRYQHRFFCPTRSHSNQGRNIAAQVASMSPSAVLGAGGARWEEGIKRAVWGVRRERGGVGSVGAARW